MDEIPVAVAHTARMLAAAGLVEAFGHVSARSGEGQMVITSTRPLATATSKDVVTVDAAGQGVSGPVDELPLETPMHLAIYRRRSDVGAICRGHPPAAVAWGVGDRPLPLLHGLGALAGAEVPLHPDIDLITDLDAAERVAATLGGESSALLRANGCLAVGSHLLEAATRLYFLEERARVASDAAAPGSPAGEWPARLQHSEAELKRAIQWFHTRFRDGDGHEIRGAREKGNRADETN